MVRAGLCGDLLSRLLKKVRQPHVNPEEECIGRGMREVWRPEMDLLVECGRNPVPEGAAGMEGGEEARARFR